MVFFGVVSGGILGSISIGLSAYGSHGFKKKLEREKEEVKQGKTELPFYGFEKREELWKIGNNFQIIHSLLLVATQSLPHTYATAASALILTGIGLFSGSMYYGAAKGKPLAQGLPIAPAGAFALMGGWITFALAHIL